VTAHDTDVRVSAQPCDEGVGVTVVEQIDRAVVFHVQMP
jgi:hypothetical protein